MKFVTFENVARIDRTIASDRECATLPYVGLEHIEKDTGHFIADFVGNPETLLATKFKFTPKHVLYGKLRPYLNKVALPVFSGVCTTEILPLLPIEEELDRIYLWALLISPNFVAWASSNVSGANLPRLDPKLLATYRFPLPPLHEQKRIAAILQKADRLRRQRHYALELSNTYLQSVFLDMFGDPLVNDRGCEIVTLGEMLSISPHIGTITPAKETGEQLCVRVGEVGQWHINLSQCKYVSLSGQELKRFSLSPGDIVLARAIGSESHLGKLSIMQKSSIPVVFDSHLMRIRPDNSRLLTPFLAYWLKTDGGRARFMQQARRTAVQFNINTEQISSIEIPVPPLTLQQSFAKVVEKFERLFAQQLEAERQAEHLFQTLLHQAFEGNNDLEPGVVQNESLGVSIQAEVENAISASPYVQLQLNY